MPRANAATQVVVQNAAKTLLANIRFASVDTPVHTLVITSSVPNEGKSTVCVNLAEAIATSGKSVLLVECDMRRRSLADLLGVHARTGIYGVLAEQSRHPELAPLPPFLGERAEDLRLRASRHASGGHVR